MQIDLITIFILISLKQTSFLKLKAIFSLSSNATTFTLLTLFLLNVENSSGTPISPLHDIPLFANDSKQTYNMVVEVPRWTNAKMEVS